MRKKTIGTNWVHLNWLGGGWGGGSRRRKGELGGGKGVVLGVGCHLFRGIAGYSASFLCSYDALQTPISGPRLTALWRQVVGLGEAL
jgi:hypothetical protein